MNETKHKKRKTHYEATHGSVAPCANRERNHMNDNTRAELSKARIETAKEDLATAYENMDAGRYRAANNRAYYAILHAIRSVLALDSVDHKDHDSAISYFYDCFLSSNVLDSYLKVVVDYAKDSRNRSDHEDYYAATREEAMRNIGGAADMIKTAERFITSRQDADQIQAAE